LQVDSSAYLDALRWACSVLGAFDAVELCDQLGQGAWGREANSPDQSSTPAIGWGRRDRLSSASAVGTASNHVARFAALRDAVASNDEQIVGLGYRDVARRAAIHMPTVQMLPSQMALVRKFAGLHKDLIAELTEFAARGDWDEYERRAHSLKGSSKWIGAFHCSETAGALEEATHKRLAPPLIALLQQRLAADLEVLMESIDRIRVVGEGSLQLVLSTPVA